MQTRQPTTLAVSITFFVIASIFVALRFVSRIFVVRRIALHDYLMLLAWVRWNLPSAGDGPCTSLGACSAGWTGPCGKKNLTWHETHSED